jgi:hypothetical protein
MSFGTRLRAIIAVFAATIVFGCASPAENDFNIVRDCLRSNKTTKSEALCMEKELGANHRWSMTMQERASRVSAGVITEEQGQTETREDLEKFYYQVYGYEQDYNSRATGPSWIIFRW